MTNATPARNKKTQAVHSAQRAEIPAVSAIPSTGSARPLFMGRKTMKPRSVRSLPLPARRWRLKVAGIAETTRLRWMVFAATLGAMMLGCTAHVPPPAAETVGQLAAGPSVWTAPVHATTDLTPQFGAIDTGDDSVTETLTTVTRADAGLADAAPAADAEELPEVAPKSDGVKLGEVRQ